MPAGNSGARKRTQTEIRLSMKGVEPKLQSRATDQKKRHESSTSRGA
jgi:hypothetical protein